MKALLAYTAEQSRTHDAKPWRSALFGPQRDYFDDPSRRKTAVCTRRAGKTKANGALLIDAVDEHPDLPCLYLTLTAKISRDSQEAELDRANARYNLGLQKSSSENRWYTRDGGFIWLAGCKDKREAEKFRSQKYSRIIIDEGGTHRKEVLQYLIDDVLSPTLTDADGQLCLTGTPGEVPSGIFHDISTGKNPDVPQWSTHHWSVIDNPHHQFGRDPSKLEAHRIERGLALDDPTWLREYCGLWVLDTRALIYAFDALRNGWDGVLPHGRKTTFLGVDLGYDDEAAFVVTTSVEGSPNIYVPFAYGESKMKMDAIAYKIQQLTTEYQVDRIYVDTGGAMAKTFQVQLQQDYGLPALATAKRDKAAVIKRVQNSLSAGRLKISTKAHRLYDEWETLAWDDFRRNHKPGIPDHNTDAFLYSFRHHEQANDIDFPVATVITPEAWAQQEMDKVKADLLRQASQRRRR